MFTPHPLTPPSTAAFFEYAGLMHVNPTGALGVYDWLVNGIMSQADASQRWESPIFFYSSQDIEMRHVKNGETRVLSGLLLVL